MRERDLKRRSQTEARQSPQRLRAHRVLAFFASGKDNPYPSTVARAGANLKAVILAQNPCVVALRNFITGWHVSYLSSEDARRQPESGPQERLSKTGDNLANVIQYLEACHRWRKVKSDMKTSRCEFLVEEPSMEAFLNAVLPRMLPADTAFEIHVRQAR